jgi:hypothetical protein
MKKIFKVDYYGDLFVAFLEELNVKHTKTFTRRYVDEHPYRESLYGWSMMLSDYRIESQSLRIQNKTEALSELKAPFVAYCDHEIVVVHEKEADKIHYIRRNKRVTVSTETFVTAWSGAVYIRVCCCC